MKVTFVVPSLTGGGAERALVLVAKALANRGYQVTVITQSDKESDFYDLSNEVKRLALDVMTFSKNFLDAVSNNIYIIKQLKKAICHNQPDIVISFLPQNNVQTILALLKTGIPVIATEQNDYKKSFYGISWSILQRLTYPLADKLVSVSSGVDSGFNWLPDNKRTVIYNPAFKIEAEEVAIDFPGYNPEKQLIMSMGRLDNQKGFDILLSSFAQIQNEHPNWQLMILGEGGERTKLERQREELGLSGRVFLPGAIRNPFPVLKKADLFVMSSRYEGFPMAHCEAMACGLPIIATDCPSGPREIIREGVDGILVPSEDVSALAKAMDYLINDEKQRKKFASNAPEVVDRFGLEKVVDSWEILFKEVTKYN
ncbi:MAG: glycosyltransferase family 4 protein [Scytonematopsis contorta HA4267-MV1]|jgi:glycosyltransferase involved in cell wall biosynthesis|nr:glycosyltransferase family 4 protein [Scytonematopsis contorta HA4267-MV1]